MRIRLLLLPFLLTTPFLATVVVDLSAQAFLSADAACDLVYALDGSGLHAIATADPEEPGRFVAALYIPGSQLLVVSALHPSVDAVAYRISRREYREVYLDLQGSPTPEDKFLYRMRALTASSAHSPTAAMLTFFTRTACARHCSTEISRRNISRQRSTRPGLLPRTLGTLVC